MLIVDYRPFNQGENENPYRTTESSTGEPLFDPAPPSRWHWAVIGAVLGALLPIGYGCYMIYQNRQYNASLGPNGTGCGMSALGAVLMIFVAGPFCCIIGGVSGWTAGLVARATENRVSTPLDESTDDTQ